MFQDPPTGISNGNWLKEKNIKVDLDSIMIKPVGLASTLWECNNRKSAEVTLLLPVTCINDY